MRHFLFFLGVLTTASTGQEKPTAPPKLPTAPPARVEKQQPPSKVAKDDMEDLPLPLPVPPAPSAATTKAAQPNLQIYIHDLQMNAPYVPSTFVRNQNDRKIEIKRGEIKAILKILAQIPPHLSARDFRFLPEEDTSHYYITILDKSLNLKIAKASFARDGLYEKIDIDQANLAKLIESEKNIYAEWGFSDAMVRLAVQNKNLIGHDSYADLRVEGEMEYLMMDVMVGNKEHLRHRETYSVHGPQVGQSLMYHAITLSDKETRQVYGVVAFFNKVQPPYELVDMITSIGPRAKIQDVVDAFSKKMKAAEPQPVVNSGRK